MDPETHHTRPRRRAAFVTTTAPPPRPPEERERGGGGVQEKEGNYKEESYPDPLLTLSKPAGYLVQLAATQVELILTSLLSHSSPFLTVLSESHAVPSRVAHSGSTVLRRLFLGLLGAGYAIAVLLAALAVAVLLGVGIVRLWVEEPVFLRQPLHFDYTHAQPCAAVSFGSVGTRARAIPAGHTTRVFFELLLPESDYNRNIGMFQVTAEVISSNGDSVASSSQPCMLRFRSLPVRLMRTFIMGIPLLVGMCSESQKIAIEMLRYKESYQKSSEGIRVRLKPRAGTSDLPQLYGAEILMYSQLPWRKELVYNWKWTFYVWISLYVYVILLIILVCCFKPFVFPRCRSYGMDQPVEVEKGERESSTRDGELSDDFSDALRRWRERGRGKRKVSVPCVQIPELFEGSTSSITGGDTSEVIEDSGDFAASESSECVWG